MKKVTIVCDGSACPNDGTGVGGWGAVLHFPESAKTVPYSGSADRATNNVMELYAILGGLRALGSEEAYEVLIKTDSQLAVQYLSGLKGPGKEHLLAIADDIRHLVCTVGHEVMLQKAKKSETMRAHALAQAEIEKVEQKPVPLKL